jgi:hypothetical protein
MAKIIVYRYDTRDFAEGEVIISNGDHFDRLMPDQQRAETAIRDKMPNGHDIRATSLYTWKHLRPAELAWKFKKGNHLYELEVDEADIIHTADLDDYSSIVTAVRKREPPDSYVERYCSGVCNTDRI